MEKSFSTPMLPLSTTANRQYYIDWIRVIAFCILIFYHTGMFFVTWDWHVKNNVIEPAFEFFMRWFGQWRLSLLFFISGVGVSFALRSRTGGHFSKERFRRLFMPLVFGMFVIVPPQIFFERLQRRQFSGSYLDFYPRVFEFIPYPQGSFSWHHLWFIAYLWVFSMLALPLFLWLRSESGKRSLAKLHQITLRPFWIYTYAIPFMLTYWGLSLRWPTTHNLTSDWYNFTFSFLLFIFGYTLGGSLSFWQLLENQRKTHFIAACMLTITMYAVYWIPDAIPDDEVNAEFLLYGCLKMLNIWSIIMAIGGYAKYYLNFNNRFLTYANEAVYPFYILHQTIEVVFAFYIAAWPMNVYLKFVLLSFLTFGSSFIIYHFLIRPFSFVRFWFGVKAK